MPMLIPLVAGAAIKYYGANQANKAGQAASAAGAAQLAADRKQAMDQIAGVTTQEANLSPVQRTAQAHQDYMDALRSGSAQMGGSYADVPGANSRYADAVKTASGHATDLATARANLIAGIRGATRSRADVHQSVLDTGTAVGGIGQDAGLDATNAGMAVQQASQVNPAYGMAGGILENIGKAYTPSAGGRAPTTFDPNAAGVFGNSYTQPNAWRPQPGLGDEFN